jgi:hypothetical protein
MYIICVFFPYSVVQHILGCVFYFVCLRLVSSDPFVLFEQCMMFKLDIEVLCIAKKNRSHKHFNDQIGYTYSHL